MLVRDDPESGRGRRSRSRQEARVRQHVEDAQAGLWDDEQGTGRRCEPPPAERRIALHPVIAARGGGGCLLAHGKG